MTGYLVVIFGESNSFLKLNFSIVLWQISWILPKKAAQYDIVYHISDIWGEL